MKIFNLVLGILFILFAVVQYNDPDPWLWIGLYSFVGILSFFAFREKYNMPIISLGIIISAIGVGILIPDFISWIQDGMPSITESMKAEKKHIELTREFLGLLLILGVLIFHFVQGRKVNKA